MPHLRLHSSRSLAWIRCLNPTSPLLPPLASPWIARMDSLFEAHFSPPATSGKPMGRCGKCPLEPTPLNSPQSPSLLPPFFPLSSRSFAWTPSSRHISPLSLPLASPWVAVARAVEIARMDSLFEAHFSPLAASGKPMGRCGKCGRFMRFVPLKPTRLFCPTCEDVFNLPQNGAIK
ncbi:unnamed protein product, partial [Closterium sp. Naga37s-1]